MSSHPLMVNPRQVVRAIVFALLLAVLCAASVSAAYGQFTLSVPGGFNPTSVNPGGLATAIIDLGPSSGFNNPVSLTCQVTSQNLTTNLPTCSVSPASQVPPADGPSLAVTALSTTPAGTYQVMVTGTSGSFVVTVTLTLDVTILTEDYTLSVSPTSAVPNSVHAGSSATTTVTVTPIASYTGNVTLACLSVSPVVTLGPVCSFNPATVPVAANGVPPTSVLTITTTGPAPTVSLWNPRIFFALWLAVPGLALVGVAASGARARIALGALLLLALAGGVLVMPACHASSSTGSNGTVTPNNTYTFTLTGADANGAAPSSTTATTVTLTVN